MTSNNGLNDHKESIVDNILSFLGIRTPSNGKKVEKVAQPPLDTPQPTEPQPEQPKYRVPTNPGTGRWLRSRLR